MLDANVKTRIREYIQAETAPRARTLDLALLEVQDKFSARGVLQSSMAIQGYARVAQDELAVRAKIIWTAIRRSHASMVGQANERTLDDLRQQVEEFMYEHIKQAAARASARAKWGDSEKWRLMIQQEVTKRGQELIASLDVEAQFYVDELKRAEKAAAAGSASGVSIYGSVGAVQTGTFATAHVSLSGPESKRLQEALESLRQAVEQNAEIETEQRAQAVELVSDATAAVKAEKPNAPKISGLLGGLAQTVRTVASLRGAWEVVRDAAIAVGIPL